MEEPPYERLREQARHKSCWGNCPRWLGGGGDHFINDTDFQEDQLEDHNVDEVIQLLRKRLRSLNMQRAGIKHDEDEVKIFIFRALKEKDFERAREHTKVRLQHRAHWMREHAKYKNLNQLIITIGEARRNLETTKMLKASNQTLGQLREMMNQQDVEQLLNDIRNHALNITQDSELLTESVMIVEQESVEQELESLLAQMDEEEAVEIELPSVPVKTKVNKPEKQSTKKKEKMAVFGTTK